MERLFLECTLRAALLAGGTAIVLYAMRVKPAAVKHRVWTAVMALMLVLPVWTAWGPKLSLRVLPAPPQMTERETTALSRILPTTLGSSPAVSTREAVLMGIYLLGLSVLLIRVATGTIRARRLAREAVLNDGVRISRFCAAPVTVGFFHPVVILPEEWRQWPRAQLEAILTHEGEHARRRDSLVQWLALLNRAVFWFHPVAWWLERTLSDLAEQACDEVVLVRGHNPGEYAEYLLDLARSVAHSGTRLKLAGMQMPGAGLPKRIRKIMEGGQVPRISRSRMACVVGICVIICTGFTAGTLARVQQSAADQSPKTERRFDGLQIVTPHDGVDFTTFSAHLTETVKRNWGAKLPQQAWEGIKGKVVVRFEVQRDGALSAGPVVDASSGNKPLDDTAVLAIRASAPFEHLPESFKGPNVELALAFFYNMPISDTASPAQPSTRFVLGDLKIEGDIHDRDGVRDRALNRFASREYGDAKILEDRVADLGVGEDLQERGYFRVAVHVVGSQVLKIADGKQRMLLTVSVDEGQPYYFGSLVVKADSPVTAPPPEVIRDLVRLKRGDLFDVSEVRVGLDRLKVWCVDHGHADPRTVTALPEFKIDDAQHIIDMTIRVDK